MTEASRTDSLRDLEHEVGVLIRRVRKVIGERARTVHPDLQPASYLILSAVAQDGPLRGSELSELFTIDKGAISRQVKHLVQLGLLDAVKDPDDARATLLSATDDAKTRLEDIVQHRRKYLDERLADWSPEELSGLVEILSRYNEALTVSG
ncbi:MarR family transcriptional regulator [Nocardioides sp. C4-1]|uniref:MarR family winged helix-turn-helix transcriptional regulator n=1 Tax=Nocardioides sp. C4-1 TaxID=3151851 RepID=UPI003267C10C